MPTRNISLTPEQDAFIGEMLKAGEDRFHVCHSRNESREVPVANPARVIFYRVSRPGDR